MDRLILLRHGKAEADAVSGQDFDRALTDRGRRDTLVVCKALAEAGIHPDLALVSPAARAVQTWELAATVFTRAVFKIVPALYEIAPAQILKIAHSEGGAARTVMIVGHNPGLGALSVRLAQEARGSIDGLSRIEMGFPTGAASVIGFDPPSFELYTPKVLEGRA
ncbi:MAG: histidine phosphatase family protein [Caulobacteraceae bacterium]|jgi:phosphohistidine phosphatase|nr:histidine phosphatase family protein [Caulobacteraceae bacterium]